MQLSMHLYMIAPHALQHNLYMNRDELCADVSGENWTFLGLSPYETISSESVQLKGKEVNFLNFSILF